MATVDVNGTTLFHEVVGEGARACLVLHGGLGIDHTAYRGLDPLGARLRLVYYDHRGNGRSGRPPLETITMEQLADDAAGLADALGLERFLVFGHSYGGFVAQELAIRHPDRLLGLVLCATTPGQLGAGEQPGPDQGPPPPPELTALMSTAPRTDEDAAALYGSLLPYYVHTVAPEALAVQFERIVYDAATLVRAFEVLSDWSSVDRLSAITAPTLLLAGAHDLFTSAPQSFRIASRIKDSDVVVFDDSGHFPWVEEPDGFFAALEEWLDRLR